MRFFQMINAVAVILPKEACAFKKSKRYAIEAPKKKKKNKK